MCISLSLSIYIYIYICIPPPLKLRKQGARGDAFARCDGGAPLCHRADTVTIGDWQQIYKQLV